MLTDEQRAVAAEYYPFAVAVAGRIARGARAAGGSAHPDDVVGCASMAVVRLVSDYSPDRDGAVEAYMKRAMRFAIIRELRAEFGRVGRKRYATRAATAHFSALDGDALEYLAEARAEVGRDLAERDAVRAALALVPGRNPERTADVCERHYVNGERAEDVAAAIGKTRDSVLHMLKAGRRAIVAHYSRGR